MFFLLTFCDRGLEAVLSWWDSLMPNAAVAMSGQHVSVALVFSSGALSACLVYFGVAAAKVLLRMVRYAAADRPCADAMFYCVTEHGYSSVLPSWMSARSPAFTADF